MATEVQTDQLDLSGVSQKARDMILQVIRAEELKTTAATSKRVASVQYKGPYKEDVTVFLSELEKCESDIKKNLKTKTVTPNVLQGVGTLQDGSVADYYVIPGVLGIKIKRGGGLWTADFSSHHLHSNGNATDEMWLDENVQSSYRETFMVPTPDNVALMLSHCLQGHLHHLVLTADIMGRLIPNHDFRAVVQQKLNNQNTWMSASYVRKAEVVNLMVSTLHSVINEADLGVLRPTIEADIMGFLHSHLDLDLVDLIESNIETVAHLRDKIVTTPQDTSKVEAYRALRPFWNISHKAITQHFSLYAAWAHLIDSRKIARGVTQFDEPIHPGTAAQLVRTRIDPFFTMGKGAWTRFTEQSAMITREIMDYALKQSQSGPHMLYPVHALLQIGEKFDLNFMGQLEIAVGAQHANMGTDKMVPAIRSAIRSYRAGNKKIGREMSSVFDWLSNEEADFDHNQEVAPWTWFMTKQDTWHQEVLKTGLANGAYYTWDPVLKDYEEDGLDVEALYTSYRLEKEGREMGHCIGTHGYIQSGTSGQNLFFSVASQEGPLVTAQLIKTVEGTFRMGQVQRSRKITDHQLLDKAFRVGMKIFEKVNKELLRRSLLEEEAKEAGATVEVVA